MCARFCCISRHWQRNGLKKLLLRFRKCLYICVYVVVWQRTHPNAINIAHYTVARRRHWHSRSNSKRNTYIHVHIYSCIYIQKCVRFCICIISKRLLAVATFRDCHCSSSSVKLSRRFSIWRQKLKLLSYTTNYFLLLLL